MEEKNEKSEAKVVGTKDNKIDDIEKTNVIDKESGEIDNSKIDKENVAKEEKQGGIQEK